MPLTISAIQQLVVGHLQDDAAKLSNGEVVAAIEEAIAGRYSKDRPRHVVADLAGNGSTYEWTLTSITAWDEGFSQVRAIEYPRGETTPAYLNSSDWSIYESPTGRSLRFPSPLTNGKYARVTFTAPHMTDASTLPASELYTIGVLAAALAARRLAATYAQTGDSSIVADSVNYRSKSSEYLALARHLEQDYQNYLGTDPDRSAPSASTTSTWIGDTAGGARLTH
jgi:hypothetical protein